MKIALDTNRYARYCQGVNEVVALVARADAVYLPFVTVAELRAGFAFGSRQNANERVLVRFLAAPRVSILFPDDQTTHHYARLFIQLRRQGTPIPDNDLWIAALAVQHNLALCSEDRHFDHLPQISRV